MEPWQYYALSPTYSPVRAQSSVVNTIEQMQAEADRQVNAAAGPEPDGPDMYLSGIQSPDAVYNTLAATPFDASDPVTAYYLANPSLIDPSLGQLNTTLGPADAILYNSYASTYPAVVADLQKQWATYNADLLKWQQGIGGLQAAADAKLQPIIQSQRRAQDAYNAALTGNPGGIGRNDYADRTKMYGAMPDFTGGAYQPETGVVGGSGNYRGGLGGLGGYQPGVYNGPQYPSNNNGFTRQQQNQPPRQTNTWPGGYYAAPQQQPSSFKPWGVT